MLFALAWWSSGRAKPLSRGQQTSLTQDQVAQTHQFTSQHQHGAGGGG